MFANPLTRRGAVVTLVFAISVAVQAEQPAMTFFVTSIGTGQGALPEARRGGRCRRPYLARLSQRQRP